MVYSFVVTYERTRRVLMSIRVLMADDDVDFLDVTAYALRRAGFEVNAVSSVTDVLGSLRTELPDIFVLDVNMPQLAGTQICQTIRKSSTTPVILMSGNRAETEIIKGF